MISAITQFFPRTPSLISGTQGLLQVLIFPNLSLNPRAQRLFAGTTGLSGLAAGISLRLEERQVATASVRGFTPERYSATSFGK